MPVPTGPGHISRLLTRAVRRQETIKFRLWKQTWIDPFPEVPGTVPEKMVYAQLKFRRIEFVFQALGFPPEQPTGPHFRPNLGEIRPDFLIPSVRAVIEVQGTYFHTQPDAEAHDLDKLAEYHAWGWYVYWIFDTDITVAPARAVENCEEAGGFGPTLGALLPKATTGDSTAPGATTADANAVAAANRARARPKSPELRVRRARGRRKTRVLTPEPRPEPTLKPNPIGLTATERRTIRQTQLARPKDTKVKVPPFFRTQRQATHPVDPFGRPVASAAKRARRKR